MMTLARGLCRRALRMLGDDEARQPVSLILAAKPGGTFGKRRVADEDRPTWSIGADDTVATATARMLDARVGSLMVTADTDGGGETVGMLTERDLLKYYRMKSEHKLEGWRGIASPGAGAATTRQSAPDDEQKAIVRSIMTLSEDCVVIGLEDTRQTAVNIMAARRVRHLVRRARARPQTSARAR
jgi:hypothetical protein